MRGIMQGDDERFNIVEPIQLGGIVVAGNNCPERLAAAYPRSDGCMRNVRCNNEVAHSRARENKNSKIFFWRPGYWGNREPGATGLARHPTRALLRSC